MRRTTGNRGIQESRLDNFFVSNSFIYRIGKCEIGHCIYSDRNLIGLEITSKTKCERGRGFWKLNTSLLQDKACINEIHDEIYESLLIHRELKDHNCYGT